MTAPQAPTYPYVYPVPRYDPCALMSLAFALIGLGLPAMVFGAIGIFNVDRTGERGLWTAAAGVILGMVETGVIVYVLLRVLSQLPHSS